MTYSWPMSARSLPVVKTCKGEPAARPYQRFVFASGSPARSKPERRRDAACCVSTKKLKRMQCPHVPPEAAGGKKGDSSPLQCSRVCPTTNGRSRSLTPSG
jgi:hypothetical protein